MSSLPRLPGVARSWTALAALGLLAGCGTAASESVSLSALAGRTLTYALVDADTVERQDAPGAHRFTVTFALPETGCPRLVEGTSATFNGQPMELEPGGFPDTGGRDACVPTRAFIDFDPAVWAKEPREDARVVLQDGSHTVTLVLRGAKAKRHFLFQGSGSPTTLRRGQTYSYRWGPEGETPGPVTATLHRVDGSAPATLALTQEASQVSFHLADTTPAADHVLRLSASLPGEALTCEGVAACEGALFHSEEFAVTVTH
jgi:hypothetical protein